MKKKHIPSACWHALSWLLFLLPMAAVHAAPPTYDTFTQPLLISGYPAHASGVNIDATLENDEPLPEGYEDVAAASVWLRWTAPATGRVQIDTIGSAFDTILTIWAGSQLASLSELVTNDDYGGDFHSAVFLEVTAGVTYQIAVYGWDGDSGPFALHISKDVTSFITGKVTGPDGITPLAGIEVGANQLDGSGQEWDGVAYALTDESGSYRIKGLPQGKYRVEFIDWEGDFVREVYDNAADFETGLDIVVAPESTVGGIDASLAGAARINGRVTGPDGSTPLEEIWVAAYRWNALHLAWEWVSVDWTDEDGNYSIGGLPGGTYRVQFSGSSEEFVTEVYENAAKLADGRDIVVAASSTVYGINASLARSTGVSGPPVPSLSLRKKDSRWELEYQPSPHPGTAMLHSAPLLSDLLSTNARIFDVPAASGPIFLDVTDLVAGSRSFFSVTEYHEVAVEDFLPFPDDPGVEEGPPAFEIESIGEFAYPLMVGMEVAVALRVLDGASREPVLANGSVALELVTADGNPVSFAYSLSPSELPMAAGFVNGRVTIAADGSLAGVYLAVREVMLSAGRVAGRGGSSARSAAGAVIGIRPKERREYVSTADGWQHPLRQIAPIAGSFGEWRCRKIATGADRGACVVGDSAGQPHLGIDLAAVPGTLVYPVRRGVVSHRGRLGSLGGYMVVVHGDGTASRYLHVDPMRQCHEVVETDTPIARVASIGKNHLHLELRTGATPRENAGDYMRFHAYPGHSCDPGQMNDGFDIPLIRKGENDRKDPEVRALYFWKADPVAKAFDAVNPGKLRLERDGLVVAQIVDREGRFLVPSSLEFAAEDPATGQLAVARAFHYSGEEDVRRLFQDHPQRYADFGYVRRVGNVLPEAAMYHYWFRWETAGYAQYPNGPRQIRIAAADRVGNTATHSLRVGPKLFAPESFGASDAAEGSTFEVKVRNFMGPFPTEMKGTPEDVITISLQTAALRSWSASFEDGGDPAKAVRDLRLTGHDEASERKVVLRIRRMGATAATQPEELKVRAASGIYPAIAHEVTVRILPADDFVLIPAGTFLMGDTLGDGWGYELPVHPVTVSAFYLQARETTKAEWDEVHAWGRSHGYTFDERTAEGKAADHPVHSVTWWSVVKWCNARSEKEGRVPCYYADAGHTVVYRSGELDLTNDHVLWTANGYRLPTEAEWEKAARGGLDGKRFPWGDAISHALANYYSSSGAPYDTSPTQGHHPSYGSGLYPYTSPVGSFAPNGYGLYDMAGNVYEWCWDRYDSYPAGAATDPRGPSAGSVRVVRGGSWSLNAFYGRVSVRGRNSPWGGSDGGGFRPARGQ